MVTTARRWDGTQWQDAAARRWDGSEWQTVHAPSTDPDPEPAEFVQVQEWSASAGTANATGPAAAPGNLLVVRAIHRAGSNGLPALIADNGANTWYPVGQAVAGGSGDVYMWYSVLTEWTNEIAVQINEDSSIGMTIFVAEWAGNAATDVLLDSAALNNASQTGPLPTAEVTTTVPGALVTGALGATVSNRTITLLTPGYTAGREHRSQQTTLIAASKAGVEVGTHGPQWSLDGGGASTTGVITAAFRPA